MDIIKVDINKSRFISDGGCGYLEPDNSFNAFLSSCNRMYYGVKADIRFTKDRVIVTSRYRDLRKLTDKKIHISLTNYEDLKNLPLKNDIHSYIATIDEFLIVCKKYNKIACIELHPPISLQEIDQLIKHIYKHEMIKYCKIIATELKYLKYIRSIDLNIMLEFKTKTFTDEIFYQAIQYHYDLTLPINKISSDLIELCHENRLKIGTTNMNDPVLAIMTSDMNIDYMYTVVLEEYRPN